MIPRTSSAQGAGQSATSIASQIAALQKQLDGLQKQLTLTLKNAQADADPKATELRVTMLRQQITSIEAQISYLSQLTSAPTTSDSALELQDPGQDSAWHKSTAAHKNQSVLAPSGSVDLYI